MKKKILSGVFALALLATAGFGVHKSLKSNANLSDLALANVEALTQSEIGDGRWIVVVYSPSHWRCDPNGGASCPGIPW